MELLAGGSVQENCQMKVEHAQEQERVLPWKDHAEESNICQEIHIMALEKKKDSTELTPVVPMELED